MSQADSDGRYHEKIQETRHISQTPIIRIPSPPGGENNKAEKERLADPRTTNTIHTLPQMVEARRVAKDRKGKAKRAKMENQRIKAKVQAKR